MVIPREYCHCFGVQRHQNIWLKHSASSYTLQVDLDSSKHWWQFCCPLLGNPVGFQALCPTEGDRHLLQWHRFLQSQGSGSQPPQEELVCLSRATLWRFVSQVLVAAGLLSGKKRAGQKGWLRRTSLCLPSLFPAMTLIWSHQTSNGEQCSVLSVGSREHQQMFKRNQSNQKMSKWMLSMTYAHTSKWLRCHNTDCALVLSNCLCLCFLLSVSFPFPDQFLWEQKGQQWQRSHLNTCTAYGWGMLRRAPGTDNKAAVTCCCRCCHCQLCLLALGQLPAAFRPWECWKQPDQPVFRPHSTWQAALLVLVCLV